MKLSNVFWKHRQTSAQTRLIRRIALLSAVCLILQLPANAEPRQPSAVTGDHNVQESNSSSGSIQPDDTLAEALYRQGALDAAVQIFRRRVSNDPADSHAWLRIGNIEHRKRRLLPAASAYRKAARAAKLPNAEQQKLRAKALLNLAIVNLELAGQAVAQYDNSDAASADALVEETRRRAGDELESARKAVASRATSAFAGDLGPGKVLEALGERGSFKSNDQSSREELR
ncbi:MAG: tetratricopeptide repeat protein [Quisquiliibacterium sp.]